MPPGERRKMALKKGLFMQKDIKVIKKVLQTGSTEHHYYLTENAPGLTKQLIGKKPSELPTELNITEILKNDKRSYVATLEHKKQSYVLKIPRDKNHRKWIGFTTFYRRSEVKKVFDNLTRLKNLGFNTNSPIICGEIRKKGMVTDSFLIYSYVDGKPVTKAEYPQLIKEIKRLHSYGRLHGDFHSQNFIVQNGEIFFLDTAFRRNLLGSLGRCYEMVYFLQNRNTDKSLLNEHREYLSGFSKSLLAIAFSYFRYLSTWKKFKRSYLRRNKAAKDNPVDKSVDSQTKK